MTSKLTEPETEAQATPLTQTVLPARKPQLLPPRPSPHDARPRSDSAEFILLYLPTMVSVYTARHQQIPPSPQSLREHVFGNAHHRACEACREETEFLVMHQKKFF